MVQLNTKLLRRFLLLAVIWCRADVTKARDGRANSCKACTDMVGKFQVCTGPQDCPVNTYCTSTGLGDGQKRCFPAKKPGGSCLEDRECLSGSYCNQPACGLFFDPLCFSYVCSSASSPVTSPVSLAQVAGLSPGDLAPELAALFRPTGRRRRRRSSSSSSSREEAIRRYAQAYF